MNFAVLRSDLAYADYFSAGIGAVVAEDGYRDSGTGLRHAVALAEHYAVFRIVTDEFRAEICSCRDEPLESSAENSFGCLTWSEVGISALICLNLSEQGGAYHRNRTDNGRFKALEIAADLTEVAVQADGNSVFYGFKKVTGIAEYVVHGKN